MSTKSRTHWIGSQPGGICQQVNWYLPHVQSHRDSRWAGRRGNWLYQQNFDMNIFERIPIRNWEDQFPLNCSFLRKLLFSHTAFIHKINSVPDVCFKIFICCVETSHVSGIQPQQRSRYRQLTSKGELRWPDNNLILGGLSWNRTASKGRCFPWHWRGHDKQWTAGRISRFNRRNKGYLQDDNEIKIYYQYLSIEKSFPNASDKCSRDGFSFINLFLLSRKRRTYWFPEKGGE
jgi:hypothetical protein